MTNDSQWQAAEGPSCPQCQVETLCLIDGVCPACWHGRHVEEAKAMEDRAERRYYRDQLRKGTISLRQMREGRLSDTPAPGARQG